MGDSSPLAALSIKAQNRIRILFFGLQQLIAQLKVLLYFSSTNQ